MGYGPGNQLQHTLNVMQYNITYLLQTAPPGELCPMAAWAAYWGMRSHAIPVTRCVGLCFMTLADCQACPLLCHSMSMCQLN